MAKGEGEDTSFIPPLNVDRPIAHVAQRIVDSDRLRRTSSEDLVAEVAYLYDYLNFAHPFREGNGRTQREFFARLLAESGRRIRWDDVAAGDLHAGCHAARTVGDLSGLTAIMAVALVEP